MNQPYLDLIGDDENKKQNHPISSRETIYAAASQPCTFAELLERLDSPSWAFEPIQRRVQAMARDNQLIIKDGVVSHFGPSKLVTSKVKAIKSGHLLINIDHVELFLNDRQAQGVFPNDEVVVRVPDPVSAQSIAVLVSVNQMNKKHLVCVYTEYKGKPRLKALDKRVKQPMILSSRHKLQDGDVLTVFRSENQRSRRLLQVQMVRKIGHIHDAGIERFIARNIYGLSSDWSSNYHLPGASQEGIESEAKNRESWCHLPLVTIDGEDAKDFDDAVYAMKLDKGYRLYVAIADVSHYVKEESELDKEARDRGNSVYLPGFVIPMLPEVLSNDLCSLRPNEKRLAMGCIIDFDESGVRTNIKLNRVVIQSHARLTYEGVDQMLGGAMETPEWFKEPLATIDNLARILRERRISKGTVVLTSRETTFSFHQNGALSNVEERIRGWSNQVIEECMLAANMAVGFAMHDNGMPMIWRCHSEPSADKVDSLREFMYYHGIEVPHEPTPVDLQSILDQCSNKPDIQSIEMMVLRTLSQAYYSHDEMSHYALSEQCYTHFTSPIRRYADLIVHRTIGAYLSNKEASADYTDIASSCTIQERRADEASWFAQAWLKAVWMEPYVGRAFKARVVSVTHFGMFVVLLDKPIEGLVHISSLGKEYFQYQEESMSLVGSVSGQRFSVGQVIDVVLKSIDLSMQRVDFMLKH